MNNTEADEIAERELAKYRDLPYEQLAALVDMPKQTTEVLGSSGTLYYLGIVVYWDGAAAGDVRVATIDGGGLRAFLPRSRDFIKAPDGSFVGEES